MYIRDLRGKNVCILGFGKEGQATLRAIEKYAPGCEVTIADQKESIDIPSDKHWLQLGTGWLRNLEKFNVIIKSPGIPPRPELESVRKKITNATQIFLDSAKKLQSVVIGVTGSKGKSTTSTLIYEMLKAGGKKTYLVGNIGTPALDLLPQADKDTIFVEEMSSYQLMDMHTSPTIAVLTAFFPEHLDYHGDIAAYKEAKSHITRFQTRDDTVFFNAEHEEANEIAALSPGKKVPLSSEDAPISIEETNLLGKHNLSNIAAATLVAKSLGIPLDVCRQVCRSFRGLPHRLESIGLHDGIEWIDDAISTTPESTIAALDALGNRVSTIILGGQDRGYDFSRLGTRITASQISCVILFPGSGKRIRQALEKAKTKAELLEVKGMEEAVQIAKKHTPQGTICLLSTASPSYGLFRNFEEKGDMFVRFVKNA